MEQMEGQMGQIPEMPPDLLAPDSHSACRGERQVEMIISIRAAQNSPLIAEHGMMEHLSKNP